MRLSDYLAARGETQVEFSKRAGLPQSAISRACQGEGMRLTTATAIVRATREEPAPDGGTVRFEDLEPSEDQSEEPAA
jgi:predicted transcriptional regulator